MAKQKNRKSTNKTTKPRANLNAVERQRVHATLNQANVYFQQGQLAQAGALYQSVLEKDPYNADAYEQLGLIAHKQGNIPLAEQLITNAIKMDPKRARAQYMLGCIYAATHQTEKAIACYKKTVALQPKLIEAHNNLGVLYKNQENYDQAMASFQTVVKLNPRSGFALSNFGNALKDSGRMKEAVEVLERATKAEPELAAAYSNLLVALNYLDEIDANDVFQAHLKWGKHVPQKLPPNRFDFKNRDQTPGRKLRVAYVSPDFHTHSVAYFIEPVLRAHDHDKFEIYAYYNNTIIDATRDRIKTLVDQWRDVEALSELEFAELVYQDQIDILIDMTGHMADNRLAVFYQKPAPIQVTWLGYPNTTGLSQIDYRVSDDIADPIGQAERFHAESLVRLNDGFLCYQGNEQLQEAKTTPGLANNRITFGSFNNVVKVTSKVIQVWAKILNAIPNSDLVIKSKQLSDDATRGRFLEAFSREGITPDRLKVYGLLPDMAAHMSLYDAIDIGLDPFPYNGTTTTCEALWMGVPVIALKGQVHASRVSASILNRVKLDDFVADSEEAYVELAIEKAKHMDALNDIRLNLREVMKASPLCNAQNFTRELEASFQKMWRTYIGAESKS